MRTHVFLLFSDFGLGGIQKKMVDLVNIAESTPAFKKTTFHFFIRFTSPFSFEKKIKNKRIIIHRIQNSGPAYIWNLIKYSIIYQPKTVLLFLHYHLIHSFILTRIPFIKKPKIILSQDVPLSFENDQTFTKKKYPTWLLKKLYTLPDQIISPTTYIANDLIRTYAVPKTRITIIPNWVLHPIIPKTKTIDILYCGRFDKQKQLNKFIEIIRKVKKRIPSIVVYMIGDGEEKKTLVADISTYGLASTIKIISPTHRIQNYMAQAKLFVLTSVFEGFPMTVLEVMSAHCVPVIYAYPGAEEYIQNKTTGFIEKNMDSTVKRICFLLQSEKERSVIAKSAKNTVVANNNVSQLLQVLSCL